MIRAPRALAALAVAGALTSGASAAIITANFGLSGSQEVPANGSTAMGVGTISFDTDTNTFDMSLFVVGIGLGDLHGVGTSNTSTHIHLGAAGTNGPIAIELEDFGSWAQSGLGIELHATGVTVTDQDVLDAFAVGNLYVNIHTTSFNDGEIRGQLPAMPQIPAPGTAALLAASGLVAASRRR